MSYFDYLASKRLSAMRSPIQHGEISQALFPFQRDCVKFALNVGRAALFLDTGLGKTRTQGEWARHIKGRVLFLAPLAVAQQTIREAKSALGMEINYSRDGSVIGQYTITNYERIELFDISQFEAIVLDESSILKSYMGKTKQMLCELAKQVKYVLACTATPAPNDIMELGNHAEFLGVMPSTEMLARWFINDPSAVGKYKLKGHAIKPFWQWVASWAACVSKPSDLGYSNEGYDLPPLTIETHSIASKISDAFEDGLLFDIGEVNATSINQQMRKTINERVESCANLANGLHEPVIVWCESNEESAMLAAAIPDAVEVKGADSPDSKESKLMAFTDRVARVIISKPSICGHGMNWQHCRRQIFCSTRYSYEYFYQAVRRSYRFGQTVPVHIDVFVPDNALPVWRAIESKALAHEEMKEHMKYAVFSRGEESKVKVDYDPQHNGSLPSWFCETLTEPTEGCHNGLAEKVKL